VSVTEEILMVQDLLRCSVRMRACSTLYDIYFSPSIQLKFLGWIFKETYVFGWQNPLLWNNCHHTEVSDPASRGPFFRLIGGHEIFSRVPRRISKCTIFRYSTKTILDI